MSFWHFYMGIEGGGDGVVDPIDESDYYNLDLQLDCNVEKDIPLGLDDIP